MQGLEVGGWGLKHKIPSPQSRDPSLRPKGVDASVKARVR